MTTLSVIESRLGFKKRKTVAATDQNEAVDLIQKLLASYGVNAKVVKLKTSALETIQILGNLVKGSDTKYTISLYFGKGESNEGLVVDVGSLNAAIATAFGINRYVAKDNSFTPKELEKYATLVQKACNQIDSALSVLRIRNPDLTDNLYAIGSVLLDVSKAWAKG